MGKWIRKGLKAIDSHLSQALILKEVCLSQFPYWRFENLLMQNIVIITLKIHYPDIANMTPCPNKILGEKDT